MFFRDDNPPYRRQPTLEWRREIGTQAFRRVYGSSLPSTLFREVGIAAIYAVLSLLALSLTLYWVSIAG